jgi:hypothetical protein
VRCCRHLASIPSTSRLSECAPGGWLGWLPDRAFGYAWKAFSIYGTRFSPGRGL